MEVSLAPTSLMHSHLSNTASPMQTLNNWLFGSEEAAPALTANAVADRAVARGSVVCKPRSDAVPYLAESGKVQTSANNDISELDVEFITRFKKRFKYKLNLLI